MPRCTVLIVDDDPLIREVIAATLEFEGFRYGTASDGATGLAAVEVQHPDVVLLDMRMPVLDGWEFTRRVRTLPVQPRIVVMTAARDAVAWATEVAADGVLPKPFDLDELLHVLTTQCRAIAASGRSAA